MKRRCSLSFVLVGLTAVLAGCLPSGVLDLDFAADPAFNERIRLDRSRDRLADSQIGLDPTLGPFRDGYDATGEGQLVSELYPKFAACTSDDPTAVCPTETLMQADCYWAAANKTSAFDQLVLDWEVLLTFAPGSFVNERDASGELRPFGACRAADPVGGDRAVLDQERWDPRGGGLDLPALLTTPLALNLPAEPTELDFGFDLPFRLVELRAVAPSSADGVCPARSSLEEAIPAFDGATTPVPALVETVNPPWADPEGTAGAWCQPVDGVFPACTYRCGVAPTTDATYQLAVRVLRADPNDPSRKIEDEVTRMMQPNVFVVAGRRKIVRPMKTEPANGQLVWQTPVWIGSEGKRRWQENFSPNVLVESVRVFQRIDGAELPVALKVNEESGRPVIHFGGYTCQGETTADGVVFPIFNPQEGPRKVDCGLDGGVAVMTTPTYLKETLDTATSAILTPLGWRTTPADTEHGEVFLELTLRAENAGEMGMDTQPLTSFGTQEIGARRTRLVTWRNVGTTVLDVRSATVVGPHAAEFEARVLSEPTIVPVPVEETLTVDGYELNVVSRFNGAVDPLFSVDAGFGWPHLRLRTIDSGSASVYGATVSLNDGYATIQSGALSLPSPASPGARWFAGRAVYKERPLPFLLNAGESFQIAVTATPQGWGDRTAEVMVEGVQVANPANRFAVSSVLTVEGAAAEARGLPELIHFPARGSYVRNALLENPGSLPLVRGAISITGLHAHLFRVESQHAAQQTLQPGESELFRLRYDSAGAVIPAGFGYHQAQLEVATSMGTVRYELRGREPLLVRPLALAFVGGVRRLEVELTNVARYPIERRGLFTTGTDDDLFVWADPSGYRMLQAGERETFQIEYTPRCTAPFPTNLTNTREAELRIATDSGVVSVPLSGEFSLLGCP